MIMNDAFKELFGPIRAGEELKEHTKAFLSAKAQNGSRAAAARNRRYPYAAACACLLSLLLGGRWLFFTPTAEISIDINPSIELGINRFDRVISINGFNEDGQGLSHDIDVKYKGYVEAIGQILCHDSITALLSGDEEMAITVICPDGQQSAKLLSGVAACTAGQDNTYCYFARPEEVAAAHETRLSCGKYKAFLELQLLCPELTPEMVQAMTMREIRERLESLSAGGEDGGPLYSSRENGRHGQGGGHQNRWRNGAPGQHGAGE